MQIFKGKAFISATKISGKVVLGNPASVVLCSKKFPDHEEMSHIAIVEKAPMTAFLKQQQDNIFDIEFYTPAGERFNLCGHATLVAAYFIYQQFGYDHIFFNRYPTLKTANPRVLESYKQSDNFRISMPAFVPTPAVKPLTEIANLLGVHVIKEVFECNQLRDVIVVLNDADEVRAAKPMFHELALYLAAENIRGIFITAISKEPHIDYEVRIFAPHLGINEDISCGSANCSLIPYWHQQLQWPSNKDFTILCPYDEGSGFFGGIETGNYDVPHKRIFIGGTISALIEQHKY